MNKIINKNTLIYLFIFLLSLILLCTINNFYGDNYFNYGFAYNVTNGMVPYRDFNVLQFPFSFLCTSLIMKVLGTKLIVYYIVTSLILVFTIFVINKLEKSVSIIILYFMLLFPTGGYNYLSLLLFFIIIYLERKNKNDFLIGIVIGLIILTHQKMVLLAIPSLFLGNMNRSINRFKGAIIPIQIILLYLFTNGAFNYFVDYAILGIFDFGNKNSGVSIFLFVELIVIIYLIYKYIKTKDREILYCIFFQIISVPIFDRYHFSLAFIPFLFCFCRTKGKQYKIVHYIFLIFIIIAILVNSYKINKEHMYINLNKDTNFYLTAQLPELDYTSNLLVNFYNSNKNKYDEIHIIHWNAYYYKLRNNIKIDKFDMSLNGNNGYKGSQKMIEEIKKMKHALFIICNEENENLVYDQNNYEVLEFIKENYEQIENLNNSFYAYEIVN